MPRHRGRAWYRATIHLDVWQWDRGAAGEVLEQLVKALETTPTTVRGGTAVQHAVTATLLEVAPEWGAAQGTVDDAA